MKKAIFYIFLSFFLCQLILLVQPVLAQPTQGGDPAVDEATVSNNTTKTVQLTNPLEKSGVTNVPQLIGKIINTLLSIVGSLALVMFIYGGFTWMLAAGNQNQIEKGRNILVWAIIGLVVIFSSYSIVHFVLKSVSQ